MVEVLMKQPPKAVPEYMAEFDERAEGVCQYILSQLQFYTDIPDKAVSATEQWLGFKMGCSSRNAATVIKWAKANTAK